MHSLDLNDVVTQDLLDVLGGFDTVLLITSYYMFKISNSAVFFLYSREFPIHLRTFHSIS